MDDNTLIEKLIESYKYQFELYRDAKVLAQKILGQMTLSRGDVTSVMVLFVEKQKLLEKIEKKRDAMKLYTDTWQERKNFFNDHPMRGALTDIFDKVQKEIIEFVNLEDQLRLFMEPQSDNGEGHR